MGHISHLPACLLPTKIAQTWGTQVLTHLVPTLQNVSRMYPLELASKAGDCPFPPCHLGARMGNLQVTLRFEKKWSISKLQSTWNNLPNYMEVIYSVFTFCFGLSNISSSHPQGQQLGLKVLLPALLGLYGLTLSCLPRSEKRSPPKNFCISHGLSLSSPFLALKSILAVIIARILEPIYFQSCWLFLIHWDWSI